MLKSVIASSAVYLMANLVNAAMPLLLLPIMTRYLEPVAYGQVGMFQTLLGAFGVLVGLNVSGAAIRQYYDNKKNISVQGDFLAACLQLIVVSLIAVIIPSYIFRDELSEFLNVEITWIYMAAFVSGCTMVGQLALGQWQVRNKVMRYASFQISQSTLNFALSIFFVVILLFGAGGRILAQMIAASIFSVIAIYSLSRILKIDFLKFDENSIKNALKYGIPLVPHVAGMYILAFVDRLAINDILGVGKVGVYMVALQIASGATLIFDGINKAYVPWLFEKLARDDIEEKKKIVKIIYAWYLMICMGVAIGFELGPVLVDRLAGENYYEARDVIGWLILGQGLWGVYLTQTNFVLYAKKTGRLSIATLISGVLNVALVFALIPLVGIKGAALAFCISTGLRVLLTWYISYRSCPMPWFKLKAAY